MATHKPGLFSRLRRAISSTVNDAVDSMSDPGREVALMLDDLAGQIQQSERDLKQALVDRKVMERKLEELRKKEEEWQKRAEQAVKLGDENLARAALQQKTGVTGQRADAEVGLAEQTALVEQMQVQIRESKSRLKALNLRRGSLMAQARAAKQGRGGEMVSDGGTVGRLDDIEARISQMEALNEVDAETRESELDAAVMDAKLAELEGKSEVDTELEALKAKMRAQGALGPGRED